MPGTDSVQINPMSGGALIAADDIGGGVQVQRVKVGWGVDGSFADVDDSAPLPTSIVSGRGVGAAQVRVPSAGTAVRLPDNPLTQGMTVRALLGNTGTVYVGGVLSAHTGFELGPGDAISLDVDNTSAVYLDATVDGDGVSLLWVSA